MFSTVSNKDVHSYLHKYVTIWLHKENQNNMHQMPFEYVLHFILLKYYIFIMKLIDRYTFRMHCSKFASDSKYQSCLCLKASSKCRKLWLICDSKKWHFGAQHFYLRLKLMPRNSICISTLSSHRLPIPRYLNNTSVKLLHASDASDEMSCNSLKVMP